MKNKNLLLLFIMFTKMNIKANLQYRMNITFLALGIFVREMVNIVAVILMFTNFNNIGGWNFYEVLFLYSLLYLSYGILIGMFNGIKSISSAVQTGSIDIMITKPLPILFQFIATNADYFTSIANLAAGILLMVFSINKVKILWDAGFVLYFIVIIVSAVLIQFALFLIISCFSIWTIKIDGLRTILFFNIKKIAGYPIKIYPIFIQVILIFIIPFAFINYFPAKVLLGKVTEYQLIIMLLSPLFAISFFTVAILFWVISIKKYKSTGS